MATKSNKGVYTVKGKKGTSFGIDYIHPGTGERIKKILKNVTSLSEAEDVRNAELTDAKRGETEKIYGFKSRVKAVLFSDMVESYLEWSIDNKKSHETDKHRSVHLQAAFKGKLMSDIRPFLIEKYKIKRSKSVKKATVNKELILGNQVFEHSIEQELYNGENPFQSVKRYKIKKKKKPGALEPDQVVSIMDEVQHPVKKDMVEFAFNTGWRISEIRKLKKEDVDLKKGIAWIVDPKNSDTVEIELNDKAIEIIKRQKSESEYVFCHLNGKPFKTNLQGAIKNAAKRAGVQLPERKAWHILRRTWASMMLQSGCDVETLRVLGNWKDFSMPMWYAEAGNRKRKRELLNKIPDLKTIKSNGRKMEEENKVIDISV